MVPSLLNKYFGTGDRLEDLEEMDDSLEDRYTVDTQGGDENDMDNKQEEEQPVSKDPAEVVANATEEYKDKMKQKLDVKKKKAEQLKKQLETVEKSTVNLEERYKGLVSKKRSEIAEEYRKAITKLKNSYSVANFSVDSKGRIVITTEMLKVQKKSWKKPRKIGVFQIRIDFSKSSYRKGIQALNTTKRKDNTYDSPTIKNTLPCWGNLANDIAIEFEERNLHEIVIDLIGYIQSPNEQHGYVSDWVSFLEGTKKMPKNYNFEKYDQKQEEDKISVNTTWATQGSSSPSLLDPVLARGIQTQREMERELANMAHQQQYATDSGVSTHPSEQSVEYRIISQLYPMLGQFLKPSAANLYSKLVADRILNRVEGSGVHGLIVEINIRPEGHDRPIVIYFNFQRMGVHLTENDEAEEAPKMIDRVEPRRVFVDQGLLREGTDINDIINSDRELHMRVTI